jgi:tight adherence protein B
VGAHHAVALFASLTLFCGMQAVFWLVRGRRKEQDERLRERLRIASAAGQAGQGLRITRGNELEGSLGKVSALRKLAAVLVHGGFSVSVAGFLVRVTAICGMVFVLVTLATGNVGSGFVLTALAGFLIQIYVSRRRSKRLRAIDSQLPKALELMMFGLRAGHSLEDTIRFAADELGPPLGGELRRCHEESELGRPIEEALLGLSLRLDPCKALRTFVEAVLVLKQTGGNLIEIIERIIDMLRAQAAYESRHRALTAEGRTSGMILGALPLLILAAVALVQPGYLGQLVSDSAGWKVLALAGLLWGFGVLWLARLVRPAV